MHTTCTSRVRAVEVHSGRRKAIQNDALASLCSVACQGDHTTSAQLLNFFCSIFGCFLHRLHGVNWLQVVWRGTCRARKPSRVVPRDKGRSFWNSVLNCGRLSYVSPQQRYLCSYSLSRARQLLFDCVLRVILC